MSERHYWVGLINGVRHEGADRRPTRISQKTSAQKRRVSEFGQYILRAVYSTTAIVLVVHLSAAFTAGTKELLNGKILRPVIFQK